VVRGRVKGILAMDRCYESHMGNGCPECEKLGKDDLCLSCELEYREWNVMRWMNAVEDTKQKIRLKEKQNAKCR